MDVSTGALARAVTYLKVKPEQEQLSMTWSSSSCNSSSSFLQATFPLQGHQHHDIFHSKLNKCDAQLLPDLRKQRAEIAPIVCYESDDDTERTSISSTSSTSLYSFSPEPQQLLDEAACIMQEAQVDRALQSRLEALSVQQQLLGSDHPDVLFLASHIRQHRRRQSSVTSNESGH
jgi:hypothetical protein